VLALFFGSVLTGCAHQDAQAAASQACVHVERGLTAEHKAATASLAQAARLETDALDQMRAALPLAAAAANANTTWQPLEATLSESNRVPLRYLLPALAAQCAGSGNNG
jgi:N-formylglutamate amidohydrolase